MEDAQQRKTRLKALREEAGNLEENAQAQPIPEVKSNSEPEKKRSKRVRGVDKVSEPTLKFRNYNVRDDKIEHTVLQPAKPPEFKEPTVEPQRKSRPEDLIANLVDKKPNQDLRRDIEKPLAKLERRTQRALVKIAQSQALESEA